METIMIFENVIICGITKNNDKFLHKSIELCINTGKMFNDYKIIIYENNSTDNTKSILNEYKNNSKFKIISEDISYDIIKETSKIWAYTQITGSDHPCRMEQIANASNKVIDEIRKETDEYSHVIWIDLDTIEWSLSGIQECFNCIDEWDVIYANGIARYNMRSYYDMYTYRDATNYMFGPEIIGEYFWDNMKYFDINANLSNLIPVVSAFGGIGIFKKEIFNKYKYDCIVNQNVIQYYTELLRNTEVSESIDKIITNECSKFPGGFITSYEKQNKTKNIYWKSNCGYDKPVVCHHVTMNMLLKNQGYKLYIHPKLLYLWC